MGSMCVTTSTKIASKCLATTSKIHPIEFEPFELNQLSYIDVYYFWMKVQTIESEYFPPHQLAELFSTFNKSSCEYDNQKYYKSISYD